ncbi:VOC family protein [Exilibacterium tricleocarpae]|uniref:VOC family protein n=1 Tax=Exilibacterium tricleocarpae TaxID=2591008 RepID=A0A545SRU9_9GAMM|nr:VOC family protein [Exilibacterium tricleocarpae]TQV67703.1 VOC family protein [Exilibacterium tricleocarpae]
MRKIAIGLLAALSLGACTGSPEPAETIFRGINYVGVSVSDLDRSSAFYGDVADLQHVEDSALSDVSVIDALAGREGIRASTRLMKSSNAQLRFMQFENRSAAAKEASRIEVYGPGIAHLCFQVAQKTKTYERFLAAGATPIGARDMAQVNPARPVYYAYVYDADELIVEIEHVDIAALELDTPPENDYRIRHISLATPDIDRAVSFYSRLLDQKKPRRVGNLFSLSGDEFDKVSGLPGTKLEFAWFQVRNLELEIIQYHSHPTELPAEPRPVDALGYNMIVFDVTDLAAAREKLVAAGGTVVSEAEPLDGGQVLFGRDPDGNLLGFQVVTADAVFSSQNFTGDGT